MQEICSLVPLIKLQDQDYVFMVTRTDDVCSNVVCMIVCIMKLNQLCPPTLHKKHQYSLWNTRESQTCRPIFSITWNRDFWWTYVNNVRICISILFSGTQHYLRIPSLDHCLYHVGPQVLCKWARGRQCLIWNMTIKIMPRTLTSKWQLTGRQNREQLIASLIIFHGRFIRRGDNSNRSVGRITITTKWSYDLLCSRWPIKIPIRHWQRRTYRSDAGTCWLLDRQWRLRLPCCALPLTLPSIYFRPSESYSLRRQCHIVLCSYQKWSQRQC